MNTNTVADRIAAAVSATVAAVKVPVGRYWTTRMGASPMPFTACDWTVAIRDASIEELSYLFERFEFLAYAESDYCYQTSEIEAVLYLGTSHQQWMSLFQMAPGGGIPRRTVKDLVAQLSAAQEARNVAEDADRAEENARDKRIDAMLDAEGVETSADYEVFHLLASNWCHGGEIRIARRMVVQDYPKYGSLVWESNAEKTKWLRAYAQKHGGLAGAKAAAKAAMEGAR